MKTDAIEIREVSTVEELQGCVDLQRAVFATPDLENSPVRHLIVTKAAGGFTLAAFDGARMVGFVLSVPGFRGERRFFYSHMTAVARDFQNRGVGARLKWAQRERALADGVDYIKWTFQPVQARNAFFNLERLGATIKTYAPNFYGTDYGSNNDELGAAPGVDSDRLFADWFLNAPKVVALSKGEEFRESGAIVKTVEIPADWSRLLAADAPAAVAEQQRIKREFQTAFAENLTVKSFARSETNPKYLLFAD